MMLESPLKKIRKPKLLKTLAGIGGRRPPLYNLQLPEISRQKEDFFVDNSWEDRVARETGDRPLAKRLSNLRKEFPYGTVPELITLDWLRGKNERYIYQAQLYGGWVAGGLVPDFVVLSRGRAMAWLVNGNYFHDRPGKREKDEADKLRLLGANINGVEIQKVVILWESRLLRDSEATLEDALAGFERGK